MTDEHVEADRICAERINYARERLDEWRNAAVAAARAELQASGASWEEVWNAAWPVHRACFTAYLQVEAAIQAERRAIVRALDDALYRAT